MGVFEILILSASMGAMQAPGAHVHGLGRLIVAVEDDGRLSAEFETPADSVYGFEGEARNADQRRAMEEGNARLLNGGSLLSFNAEARCAYQGAELVEDAFGEEGGLGGHDHGHGEHGHEQGHDHGHDHESHGAHSDVRVLYRFDCDRPDRLTRIETGLFEAFPRLQDIDGVFLSTRSQTGFELDRASPGRRLQR